MAVTILSAGGLSGASNLSTVQRTTERLKESSKSKDEISVFEGATEVSISQSQKGRREATSQALRDLSLAESLVDVATSAADEINSLVSDSLDLAKKITDEVNPNRREELSQEAASLISSIDTVVSNANVNGISVIGNGPQVFQFNRTPGDQTSEDALQLIIPDVAVARNSLGLDSLSSSSFNTDNETTIESLEGAKVSLTNVSASLDSARTDIRRVANEIGIDVSGEIRNATREKSASKLAQDVAVSIEQSQLLETNNLDPLQVVELLSDDPNETSSPETAV